MLSQTSRTQKRFNAVADASRIGNLTDRPPPSVTITNRNQSRSIMQEFRFTSNDGFDPDWKWLGGVFYRKAHMTEVSDILASDLALPIPQFALNLFSGLLPGFITEEGKINTARGAADPVNVTETALFGEVTRTWWDRLDLTVGLRAYQTVSDSAVYFSGPLALPQAIDELQTQSVKRGKLTERGVSPKVAVKYIFNDNVSLYGSVARGFRFGGAQVLIGTFTSQAPDFYKSDVLWSYEIGLRTQWLDRTLTVDLTPFQIDWIDPQLQQADATGLGSFFDNVGGARGRGAELAIRYLTPVPGLAVAFAGSYVNTVTTEPFTTSTGDDTQPGTQWPLAAKWQSASTLAYQRPVFGSWAGGLTAVYATISSAPNTLSYLDTVFGYKTLDLLLNLGNAEIAGRPELSLNLSNATDVRGKLSGVNNPQFASNFNYIRPRTLIARLSLAF